MSIRSDQMIIWLICSPSPWLPRNSQSWYPRLECADLERYIDLRESIILAALFFPSIKLLSHWVLLDKVFNEATSRCTMRFIVALFFPSIRFLSHWVFPDKVFNEATYIYIPQYLIGEYSRGSVVNGKLNHLECHAKSCINLTMMVITKGNINGELFTFFIFLFSHLS